ncbi:hypothetical protein GP486_005553 [Trichoglossum hirsutum]|uniref:DUF7580 domain-containing protein n=1 Tax=Trichoglossum hirsutum TaxID=265104 RepID=A0A9P8L913_9PEZI|nr:hypothetical protein GP486_005553 [Trichoglossum hirsutum]
MVDPATAASLTFAVLPLIISAVENYEVTFQPFVIYRRYVKEMQRFTAKLGAQKAIFLNECQLLLLAVSHGQNIDGILKDPNHPSRKDEALDKELQELLGASFETCVSTLNLINETLGEVTSETQGFQDILENKTSEISAISLLRQKLKISFSKKRLTGIIDDLRRHNEDLYTLSRQIRDLATERAVQASPASVTNQTTSQLRMIQEASHKLYDVLASKWSCDDRVEHSANISLDIESSKRRHHTISKAHFSMALICVARSTASAKPVWLDVESVPYQTTNTATQDNEEDRASTLKASLQQVGATSRSVRFDLPSTIHSPDPSSSSTSLPNVFRPEGSNTQLDLSTIENLCQYFHVQLHNRITQSPCVGFLQKTNTLKHFIYPCPSPPHPAGESKSLETILEMAAAQGRRHAWETKLRLARLLALSVLCFQSTPWLREGWGSSDIHFFGVGDMALDSTLNSPYLNTRLLKDSTASQTWNTASPRQISSSIAPNGILFSLGVVLLELGYDAPLQNMRREDDLKGGEANQYTDFFTAKRLGRTVSKELNARYGVLVRRCLNCDFGVGTELETAELQNAFVLHVVNELERCIKAERDIDKLIPPLASHRAR